MTTTAKGRKGEIKSRQLLAGAESAAGFKKFQILQYETAYSVMFSDCVPVIMDLVTCDLNVDKAVQKTLLTSLVQMVVSSEKVVRKLSAEWKTDALMRNTLRVMREYVMTQYKHYQLYTHNVVTVIKCLARVMKNSKAKEDEFINTTYSIGKDNCTVLDVLFKPIKYVMDMNSMFNDLGFMTLDREDTVYVNEIKHYLKQVFDKMQNKLDLISETIGDIVKRYENRCENKKLADEKWKKIKEKFLQIFELTIIIPCLFTLNVYFMHYFPNEEDMKEYLNKLTK